MPKFDLILKPGEPLPEEFAVILNKRLSQAFSKKLLKHGGLIRLSASSPYVDRKAGKMTPIVVSEAFIAELQANVNDGEMIRARLQSLTIKQLREICDLLHLPVRSQASSGEIREAVVQRLQSGQFWQKISGSQPSSIDNTKQKPILYFAYGSNLDWEQMRGRCPSAKYVAIAELPNHRLAFTRESIWRRCGVLDVVPDDSKNVWGVVYEILESEIGLLDEDEGYRPGRERVANAYVREQHQVFRDGDKKHPLPVWLYVGNPQANPPPPNAEYKSLLIKGATHWKLPADYIGQLNQIVTL
jgi:gamma-glutamylcyclotransferase (GGCT)/AIG2-like uncharacterized protein YtfP